MFGSFDEEALARYEELVRAEYKEKRLKQAHQGSEWADTNGVGPTDHSFIDTGESQSADDYSETYDFTTCIKPNGQLYGISRGKCRKGSKVDAETVRQLREAKKTPKQKQREAIRKRGETAVKKDKAERILKGLQQEGARDKKATERRASKDKGHDREEQVRQLRAKAFLTRERLKQKAKRMKEGPQKEKVQARVDRLQTVLKRLDREQGRLRDAAPKRKSEGFGNIPKWATEGRGNG